MPPREGFEAIGRVVGEAGGRGTTLRPGDLAPMEEHDVDLDSAHAVATVLGRHARRGEVEVVHERPYRYRLEDRTH